MQGYGRRASQIEETGYTKTYGRNRLGKIQQMERRTVGQGVVVRVAGGGGGVQSPTR